MYESRFRTTTVPLGSAQQAAIATIYTSDEWKETGPTVPEDHIKMLINQRQHLLHSERVSNFIPLVVFALFGKKKEELSKVI